MKKEDGGLSLKKNSEGTSKKSSKAWLIRSRAKKR